MKVLWFEISVPCRYREEGRMVAGWQDSLEIIVKDCPNIELLVAFETTEKNDEVKVVDGITYIPIYTRYSFIERRRNHFTWSVNECKLVDLGRKIIDEYCPDIIHVFGNEWPYGLLANYTNTPVVIHIQGSIIPYNNALYPPRYNGYTVARAMGLNMRKQWRRIKAYYKAKSRLEMEKRIWQSVSHYMGRTSWDRALVNMIRPDSTYHHVEEALRPAFMLTEKRWRVPEEGKLRLLTVGCSSFWKGVDVILKTAHVLKTAGINFEWNVAGSMSNELKEIVEKKEGLLYRENNICILGFCSPEQLIEMMCRSTIYVHTAYIENSPNSICEAQILGMPVVSTMVGGISTLVRSGVDGELLPANDPWQMANAIVELAKDKERMLRYSENGRQRARKRHSKENILSELMECYKDIMGQRKKQP